MASHMSSNTTGKPLDFHSKTLHSKRPCDPSTRNSMNVARTARCAPHRTSVHAQTHQHVEAVAWGVPRTLARQGNNLKRLGHVTCKSPGQGPACSSLVWASRHLDKIMFFGFDVCVEHGLSLQGTTSTRWTLVMCEMFRSSSTGTLATSAHEPGI